MSIRNSRNAVAHVFRIVISVIFGIVAAVFFALLFGIVVMHLWNWLMPENLRAGEYRFLAGLRGLSCWRGCWSVGGTTIPTGIMVMTTGTKSYRLSFRCPTRRASVAGNTVISGTARAAPHSRNISVGETVPEPKGNLRSLESDPGNPETG